MTPSSSWFGWTLKAEQQLRDLAATGLSASQIAIQMGAATRNTIIGKAHRLGVKIGKPTRPAKPTVAAYRRAAPKLQQEARKMPVAAVSLVLPLPPPPPPSPAPSPDGGVRLMDIRDGQCRWPIGDPKSADFVFCGAPAERSFCPHHHRLVYVPTARQIARRAA